jgi:hypothetical protein
MTATPPPAQPGKCPDCRTADLAYGREVCQACSVVRILAGSPGLELRA